jgi:uncharacterized integral membrane protein (TIGR00698 family)
LPDSPFKLSRSHLLLIAAAIGVAIPKLPEVGLGLGIALGLCGLVTIRRLEEQIARYFIQACVILLGLRMDLHEVVKAGASGILFAIGTISSTFILGWLLGKWLKTDTRLTTLISSGTAICGGSAIAAVGSTIRASPTHMSVATGAVFILNAAALYLFPVIGHQLHLSATQFGTWAGIAIHDVSSVVGAGTAFDRIIGWENHIAVETATVVKLSRVLWIIPICITTAALIPHESAPDQKRKFPWFIGLFLFAAALRTTFPEKLGRANSLFLDISTRGMTIALLLIGAGLTWRALKSVGPRPLIQGVILWIFISATALFIVRATVS